MPRTFANGFFIFFPPCKFSLWACCLTVYDSAASPGQNGLANRRLARSDGGLLSTPLVRRFEFPRTFVNEKLRGEELTPRPEASRIPSLAEMPRKVKWGSLEEARSQRRVTATRGCHPWPPEKRLFDWTAFRPKTTSFVPGWCRGKLSYSETLTVTPRAFCGERPAGPFPLAAAFGSVCRLLGPKGRSRTFFRPVIRPKPSGEFVSAKCARCPQLRKLGEAGPFLRDPAVAIASKQMHRGQRPPPLSGVDCAQFDCVSTF